MGFEGRDWRIENPHRVHIRPEYGNWNVSRDVRKPSKFDAAHPRKPKLANELSRICLEECSVISATFSWSAISENLGE